MTPVLSALLSAAVAGAIGSLHCLGMCGGFAVAVNALPGDGRARSTLVLRHVAYHAGKITAYVFLGAFAATAGHGVHALRGGQIALSVVAGLLMMGVGLQLLGLLPARRGGGVTGWFSAMFAPLLRIEGPAGALSLGVFNGLLPCPLVYAFAAQAAASGSVVQGMAIMLGLGVGTVPALSAAALAGQRALLDGRRQLRRIAAVLLIVFGVLTVVRGSVQHHHGGGHGMAHESGGHPQASTSQPVGPD